MKAIWKNSKVVLSSFVLLWLSFFIWTVLQGKADSFLQINLAHNSFLDALMPYSTHLGDGLFAAAIGLLFMFKNYRSAFIILSAFIVSGLLAQFFKGVVFPDMLRPLSWFEQMGMDIHTIEGVKVRRHHSFPSGHTTSAFALFFSLIFIFRNKALHFLFLAFAIVAAYSRIYLGQHFPEDVLAGSVLGTTTALLAYVVWHRSKWKFLDNKLTLKKT